MVGLGGRYQLVEVGEAWTEKEFVAAGGEDTTAAAAVVGIGIGNSRGWCYKGFF